MSYIPEQLREQVFARAQGFCEYCRLHANFVVKRHEVDHIYAEKHSGLSVIDNLCLSCLTCNRYKGSDLCSIDPDSGEISALFHPRRDIWSDHFQLSGARIVPLTARGRVTVKVLHINDEERLTEREFLISHGMYP